MTRRLLMGSEAICEGAIAAGVRFYAGYPITPATEVAEFMSARMPQVGGSYVQMEDEMGSFAAAMGASCAGVKAMTASSGPGLALMQEEISHAIAGEIPVVLVNVGRHGPGIGNATGSAQMEVMQAKYGPNGDCPMIALSPSTIEEAFWLTVKCVNLAERYRTPTILLTEGLLALQRSVVDLPDYGKVERWERPRPEGGPSEYANPYMATSLTSVPPMGDFGTGYRSIFRTGGIQPQHGAKMTRFEAQHFSTTRLTQKVEAHRDELAMTEALQTDDAEVLYVAFGTQFHPARAAMQMARAKGIKAGVLRLITIWPFPDKAIRQAAQHARLAVVPEMNMGQLRGLVTQALAGAGIRIDGVNHVNSLTITPQEILAKTEDMLR